MGLAGAGESSAKTTGAAEKEEGPKATLCPEETNAKVREGGSDRQRNY